MLNESDTFQSYYKTQINLDKLLPPDKRPNYYFAENATALQKIGHMNGLLCLALPDSCDDFLLVSCGSGGMASKVNVNARCRSSICNQCYRWQYAI